MSPTVEVDRGYAHILELSNTTSNFLFEVCEAKEGGVSVSFRKYPILDTDSIFKMRIGSSSKAPCHCIGGGKNFLRGKAEFVRWDEI